MNLIRKASNALTKLADKLESREKKEPSEEMKALSMLGGALKNRAINAGSKLKSVALKAADTSPKDVYEGAKSVVVKTTDKVVDKAVNVVTKVVYDRAIKNLNNVEEAQFTEVSSTSAAQ